jgi:hypothetical protein
LRLKNNTNIPNDKIREMISFVRPPGISNFDVRISNSQTRDYHGRCYYNGAGCHPTANPFIVVRVTQNESYFPIYTTYKKGKGYIDHILLSREEAVILVLTQELRHLWHKKIPKGYRVWGARGQYSDRDADAYAIKKVREWRRQSMKNKTTDAMRLCICII